MSKPSRVLSRPKPFNASLAVLVSLAVVGVGYYVLSTFAAVGSATLSVVPSSTIVNNGTTFTVSVRENSGTAPVNAVQANLTYPAASLELVSIDTTGSAFPLEAQNTGGAGSISLARATNGGAAPVTGDQLVARLTFKGLMTTGSAALTFAAGSAVVSSIDSTGLTLTTVNGTYSPDVAAPSIPTSLRTTGTTGTSIAIAWNASTDNLGVTKYNVYRDGIRVSSPTGLTFNDTGLVMGTQHTYAVSASDAAGNESAKSVQIIASTPDTAAPTVPTGLAGSALAYNQIRLTWTSATDTGGSGLAGYRVYRNGATTPVASVAPSTSTPTYTDNNLTGVTAYSYTVSAYDGAGNESAKTASVSVTTPAQPDTTPPSTPAALQTTSTTLNSISLSWTPSTDNVAVAGYQVLRNGTLIASPGTSPTFTDTALPYGTSYTYTVRAVDTSGNLSAAATLSASTLPLKVGDVNQDNAVNIFDLSIFLSHWGMSGVSGDFNNDGAINIFDLSLLLSNWGK